MTPTQAPLWSPSRIPATTSTMPSSDMAARKRHIHSSTLSAQARNAFMPPIFNTLSRKTRKTMLPNAYSNVLSRTETATISGTAATKITPTVNRARGGLEVFNADATLDLYIRAVARNATAPTMTDITDAGFIVAPGVSVAVLYKESIDLYAINSSAAATTSVAVVTELG